MPEAAGFVQCGEDGVICDVLLAPEAAPLASVGPPSQVPPSSPERRESFLASAGESDTRLRVVLQLMKLARQKELLRFFQWLAGFSAKELPDNLLGLMLLYSLHTDSDLDAKRIYHTLSTNPELEKNAMSVAEKLKAEGRVEGRVEGQQKGLWIGKIQAFEEFLDCPVSHNDTLSAMGLEELEARHRDLHREYESRFKRR